MTPEEGSSPQSLEDAGRMDFALFYKRLLFKKKKKDDHRNQLPLKAGKQLVPGADQSLLYLSIEMF